jgi:hypothetical protein
VVLVTWAPSSRNANASVVPRSFSLGQVRGPAVVFAVTSRCPSRDPGPLMARKINNYIVKLKSQSRMVPLTWAGS